MSAPERIDGTADILLLCDHASNAVPADVDLGVPPQTLAKHIAIDIGAADLTRALAADLASPAILGTVSRLVIDLHRQPDHPALIPTASDGHIIPGNQDADRAARIARFHAPYHRAIAAEVRARRPALIASIHSFTPALESAPAARPWQIGILYNRDVRAARLALRLLRARGLALGDNEPYSGRVLNATLDRHGEANGIPSFAVEVRNDLIAEPQGVARWAEIITPILTEIRNRLAPGRPPAT